MEGAGLMTLAVECLEIVESALSCDFALELLQAVEGHAGCVVPGEGYSTDDGYKGERGTHS